MAVANGKHICVATAKRTLAVVGVIYPYSSYAPICALPPSVSLPCYSSIPQLANATQVRQIHRPVEMSS